MHAAELGAMRQVVAGLCVQLHAVLIERRCANTVDGPSVARVGGTPQDAFPEPAAAWR
jgi:hypothetical protein